MLKKTFTFFVFAFLFSTTIFAQEITVQSTKYCLTGIISDTALHIPVNKATIEVVFKQVPQGKTPPVIFTKSDSSGSFTLCSKRPIRSIKISMDGYTDLLVDNTNVQDSVVNLNTIFFTSNFVMFKGGTISAKKEAEPVTIENKTYSVSQNVLATGGTAIDALKQIPAVNVDNDGNISLRGSNNITIYINGKQSSLSGSDRQALLLQIPAANIESIDINTNPGAKQDAEGMSGIINITLKSNTAKKKNGYITLGIGTNNKYNGNATFNTNYKKWNFSNTLSFRQNNIWGRGYNLRTNYINNTSNSIDQYSNSDNLNHNYALSGNIEFNATKKFQIATNYLFSNNLSNDDDNSRNYLGNANDSVYQIINRRSLQNGNNRNMDNGISFRKTFDKATHNLIGIANYSSTRNVQNTDLKQDELSTSNESVISVNPYLLYTKSNNAFSNTLLQLDYTKPFTSALKFETGAKYTGRHMDNNFEVDSFNYTAYDIERDLSKSNHFIYDENVSAVYAMITHTYNPIIKYNLGLRVENTAIKGSQLATPGNDFDYNYTNLFPSGSISFTLQKKYKLPDIQVSYSRRINRPNQRELNPFLNFSDPYNLSMGNPNLKPELADAGEISAIYNTKKIVFTATVYARQTNRPISRYRTVDSTGVSLITQLNLGYNRSTGGELIMRFNPIKNMRITLNGNIFKYIVSGNVLGNDFVNERINYSGKANITYQFWKKTDIQASVNYMSPNVTPQGSMRPMYGFEIGGKKDLIKDKLSMSLNLSDVFNNRRFAMKMTDATFSSDIYRKRESRILMFTLTWKFGNQENQAQQNKAPVKQQEKSNDMDL